MDPITQSSLGALVPLASMNSKRLGLIALCGCLAGLAPDLDIFINSKTDPLLFLEYHRQFTHSLIFIPVGAFAVACFAHVVCFRRLKFKVTYLACLLGYATHGLLDACTSYGTQLFWPFSDYRVAWNNMSIVDPLFTLPLLLFITLSIIKKNRKFAAWGVVWVVAFISFGLVQSQRAISIAYSVTEMRGHEPLRITIKPSFGNIVVWKSIYEHNGRYYVDAIRTGISGEHCAPGESIAKLDVKRDLPWLQNGQQLDDLERFRWFSNDYLAIDPYDENRVIDVRYSFLPNKIKGLWGIQLTNTAPVESHVKWVESRGDLDNEGSKLWNLITGSSCQSKP